MWKQVEASSDVFAAAQKDNLKTAKLPGESECVTDKDTNEGFNFCFNGRMKTLFFFGSTFPAGRVWKSVSKNICVNCCWLYCVSVARVTTNGDNFLKMFNFITSSFDVKLTVRRCRAPHVETKPSIQQLLAKKTSPSHCFSSKLNGLLCYKTHHLEDNKSTSFCQKHPNTWSSIC